MPAANETPALRSTLGMALQLMNAEQLSELLEEVEKTLAAATTVSDRRGSEFLASLVDGYKIVQFRVAQAQEIAIGTEASANQLRFVCARCKGFPVDINMSNTCIMCGDSGSIEVDRIEPP